MCGIFGILHCDGQCVDTSALEHAGAVMCHRGPDDQGFALANSRTRTFRLAQGPDSQPGLDLPFVRDAKGDFDLALGFRRLSILDLSLQGHQPMVSADGQCIIVFNGEIYNYIELRDELIGHGYSFKSTSDTEVLLAAYREWGSQALNRFIGMFSLSILDLERGVLFLARDNFGIKPLYYTFSGKQFAFASEIATLLSFSDASRRVNADRLFQYLRFGRSDNDGATLFEDVQQLPAGHFLEIPLDRPGRVEPQLYWEPTPDEITDLSFEEAAERLREMFLENVRLHLRSDVPVGAALSGGIDSSAIVMAMRHLSGNSLDLHTFSYLADDPVLNEEKWIDIVGAASNATVHKVQIKPGDLVDDIDRLIVTQGEPFGSTSIYAQSRVFRLAQDAGIKVMLDGQGADEILGGYSIAIVARFASLIRQGKLAQAADFFWRAQSGAGRVPGDTRLWLRAGYFFIPRDIQRPFRTLAGQEIVPEWINGAWFEQRGIIARPPEQLHARKVLREELFTSVVRTSLPALLRYEDRNSMEHSIESRVPFLTPSFVNFVLSLPEEYIVSPGGTTKSIFRKAMRGLVPDAILDRKDKIGFATPEKALLTTLKPWVEDTLSQSRVGKIPMLNSKVIQERWQMALNNHRSFDGVIWRWVNLTKWAEAFGVDFAA